MAKHHLSQRSNGDNRRIMVETFHFCSALTECWHFCIGTVSCPHEQWARNDMIWWFALAAMGRICKSDPSECQSPLLSIFCELHLLTFRTEFWISFLRVLWHSTKCVHSHSIRLQWFAQNSLQNYSSLWMVSDANSNLNANTRVESIPAIHLQVIGSGMEVEDELFANEQLILFFANFTNFVHCKYDWCRRTWEAKWSSFWIHF